MVFCPLLKIYFGNLCLKVLNLLQHFVVETHMKKTINKYSLLPVRALWSENRPCMRGSTPKPKISYICLSSPLLFPSLYMYMFLFPLSRLYIRRFSYLNQIRIRFLDILTRIPTLRIRINFEHHDQYFLYKIMKFTLSSLSIKNILVIQRFSLKLQSKTALVSLCP